MSHQPKQHAASRPEANTAPNNNEALDAAPASTTTTGDQIRSQGIQFLIIAGSIFFVVMVTQYVMLVLDKPEPIPWQQGETGRLFQVDVNQAAWAEWTQLEDLGADLAMRIVADRDANGPFRAIDDLLRVEGIGRTTLDRIRPSLTISHESANKQE